MKINDFITRARSQIGLHTIYHLGGGKLNPTGTNCHDEDNTCDCSGYVCWSLDISRQTHEQTYLDYNGGWLNTNGIVHDAKNHNKLFKQIPSPKKGCLCIYPSNSSGRSVGHVGIVATLDSSCTKMESVIHCSSLNYRQSGDAIKETNPAIFMIPETIYAWYTGLED